MWVGLGQGRLGIRPSSDWGAGRAGATAKPLTTGGGGAGQVWVALGDNLAAVLDDIRGDGGGAAGGLIAATYVAWNLVAAVLGDPSFPAPCNLNAPHSDPSLRTPRARPRGAPLTQNPAPGLSHSHCE